MTQAMCIFYETMLELLSGEKTEAMRDYAVDVRLSLSSIAVSLTEISASLREIANKP